MRQTVMSLAWIAGFTCCATACVSTVAREETSRSVSAPALHCAPKNELQGLGAEWARFAEFVPAELAAFRRLAGEGPLTVGDVLDVHIRAAGTYRVRVTHRDENSFTLTTLPGHPEAGRITFGAYPNERGDVIFHIRSRARSGSVGHYLGFVAMGEAMQTETWAEFVNRVALTVGDRK